MFLKFFSPCRDLNYQFTTSRVVGMPKNAILLKDYFNLKAIAQIASNDIKNAPKNFVFCITLQKFYEYQQSIAAKSK